MYCVCRASGYRKVESRHLELAVSKVLGTGLPGEEGTGEHRGLKEEYEVGDVSRG